MVHPASLESVPPEILSYILDHVDTEDLCSVRLASKALAANSTQSFLKWRYCTYQLCWDNVPHLQEFEDATMPGSATNLIEELIIKGIWPLQDLLLVPHSEDAAGRSAPANLLASSLRNILEDYPNKHLALILSMDDPLADPSPYFHRHCEGQCERFGRFRLHPHKWPDCSNRMTLTFRIVFEAFCKAKMPLDRLYIFNEAGLYGLHINQITWLLDRPNVEEVLRDVRHLSLNLSMTPYWDREKGRSESSAATGRQHARNVLKLFQLCKQLNSINLKWHGSLRRRLPNGYPDPHPQGIAEMCLLDHIVPMPYVSLRHIKLMHFIIHINTLVQLLESNPGLSSIRLTDSHLEGGSYQAFFDRLRLQPKLKYYRLENIYQGRLIVFKYEGEPPYRMADEEDKFPSVLEREGAGVHTQIAWREITGSRTAVHPIKNEFHRRTGFLYSYKPYQ